MNFIRSLLGFMKLDGTRAMTGILNMGGNKVTGAGAPTVATDLVTKGYGDANYTGGGGGFPPRTACELTCTADTPDGGGASTAVGSLAVAFADSGMGLAGGGIQVVMAGSYLIRMVGTVNGAINARFGYKINAGAVKWMQFQANYGDWMSYSEVVDLAANDTVIFQFTSAGNSFTGANARLRAQRLS